MRRSLKACVLIAAASGALGASGAAAYRDAGTTGRTTAFAGVLSSNITQARGYGPVTVCGDAAVRDGALTPAGGAWCGNGGAPAPSAQRPPLAPRTPAADRRAAKPVGHRAPATVKPAPGPAARAVDDPRLGAVARAGASAGSALLASTGMGELPLVAGAGGGLLLGGALLLLRRARTRRR